MAENITPDDGAYMRAFIEKVCTEVGPGAPCTPQERQRAQIVQKEMESLGCLTSVTMEDFTCAPRAFLGWIRLVVGIMAIAISCFFLKDVNIVFLVLGIILGAVVIVILWEEFFSYKEFIDFLFKKKQSANVVGQIKAKGELKKIVIFSGHHDSAFQFNLLRYLKPGYFIAVIMGMIAIFLFTILSALLLAFGFIPWIAAWITDYMPKMLYWAVPVMVVLCFFQGSAKNGGTVPGAIDNLSGDAVVLGLGKVLSRHPDLIPEGTEIRLVSFGCEEAGLRGAYRYVARHLDELRHYDAEDFNLDSVCDPRIQTIFKREDTTRTTHSPVVVAKMVKAAEIAGVAVRVGAMPFVGGGTDATAFSKSKVKASNIFSLPIMDFLRFYHQPGDNADKVNQTALENCLKIALEYVKIARD